MSGEEKMQIDHNAIRRVLLEIVSKYAGTSSLQPRVVLEEASKVLGIKGNHELEQAALTVWYDLFRNGQIAWGYNISNPEPPFCHVTALGRKTLETLSRDPANPDGYTKYLSQVCTLSSVAQSYVSEALKTYNSDCYRATAVMIGAAAESIVLELRDSIVTRIRALGQTPSASLLDWRIKQVFDELTKMLDNRKNTMGTRLKESYESFWQSFSGQLRMTRNDAGHPTSLDPVTSETAHSSLLIFPEFAKFAHELKPWISTSYT
ncbi:MAG: hypothetical protein ABSG57_13530 [Candidatus Bathyarchaeia archaeon]|jgi:hypothetical protein